MKISLVLLLTLAFCGCIRDKKIPKGILSQNEMRKLMWDLIRADAFVGDFIMKDSTCNQKQESTILYEEIFNIHSTTREVFKKSLVFYQDRPDLFKEVADSLRIDETKTTEYPGKKLKSDTAVTKTELEKAK